MMTAKEQIELSDSQWEGSFRVNFIVEEGFESTQSLSHFCLTFLTFWKMGHFDTEKLWKKHNLLQIKATPVAMIHGHPGP
jgi:hypothetical protein